MIVVVMGVAGSGKSTIGAILADALGFGFLDADVLHPAGNIAKMARGIPLTEDDRAPWLAAVHARMREAALGDGSLVVACSALRQSHRDTLAAGGLTVSWVYLKGDGALIRSRLEQRDGHFMKADLLRSQLDVLEEPADAIVVDVAQPPTAIVEHIVTRMRDQERLDGAPLEPPAL